MQHQAPVQLPRVAITFCTGCRWNLRAAYYCQELLATFGNSLGEVALIPATGGIFTVRLTYTPDAETSSVPAEAHVEDVLIWDRKVDGGFPETKILKQRVRNHIDPGKSLGHSDAPSTKSSAAPKEPAGQQPSTEPNQKDSAADEPADACIDCA